MIKKAYFFFCVPIMFFLLNLYPSFGEEHFILANEEGIGFLVYPRQIEEGPDGNIYAFDSSDSLIKVYSPEGKYLRKIGGKGQGPGELQRADGATFGFTPDGKLYFTEYIRGHRWITLMELSGEFNKVLTPEISKEFGINSAFPLNDGGFLVHLSFTSRPERKKDYFLYRNPRALVRINSNGKIISEIIKMEYFTMISSISDGATSGLPFIPVFTWTPFKNSTVIFADGTSKNLKIYDYNGKFIREIVTTLPEPDKVTGKDLNVWRKRREELMTGRDKYWYDRWGKVIEKYKKSIYEKKPNLSGISLTPDGNILITGPSGYEERKINYWLLENNGKTLTRISLEGWGLRISEHFIFFMTSDEDENILVHCIKRKGTEKEDLSRIEGTLRF